MEKKKCHWLNTDVCIQCEIVTPIPSNIPWAMSILCTSDLYTINVALSKISTHIFILYPHNISKKKEPKCLCWKLNLNLIAHNFEWLLRGEFCFSLVFFLLCEYIYIWDGNRRRQRLYIGCNHRWEQLVFPFKLNRVVEKFQGSSGNYLMYYLSILMYLCIGSQYFGSHWVFGRWLAACTIVPVNVSVYVLFFLSRHVYHFVIIN